MKFDSDVTGGIGIVGGSSGSFRYLIILFSIFFKLRVGFGSFGGTLTEWGGFQFSPASFFLGGVFVVLVGKDFSPCVTILLIVFV